MNKAETLHFKDDSYFFTGAGQKFQVPSVIRLKYNIKKKGNPVYKVSRMGVFSRDNFTCQYCGSRKQNLTLDHVHPRHMGGLHVWENLVTCCSSCNLRKGNKSVEESGFKMSKKPFVPSVFSFVVNDEVESIWDNFKSSFV
jgi:5-methylcytosine-specific restriction endonuclease McrA